MTTEEIIITILSSSLVTSFFTAYFQRLLQKSDYKLKYFEKVTERRLHAYEQVINITSLLKVSTKEKEKPWSFILGSIDIYHEFMVKLATTVLSNIWYSDDLRNKLTELNIFLKNLETEYEFSNDLEIQEIGKQYRNDIRKLSNEISTILHRDFKNLNDIDKFNRKTGKSSKVFLVK
ncbi:hypothetical protein [Tenacibaculum singaporense]|uniref:Uncharacterized protein n=1 Tax=Tenacibaculum singaporense TaxID=2358479 RepID=A0A3Q8RSK7_9FLAO|nr:hypothetical protein [Tenacibaculum singaporense]AZJ35718.1 hypothetical protein D6T69_09360 [Tenacibaculum singaporense]